MSTAEPFCFRVRVRPDAGRRDVGGTWGEGQMLVVSVTERAVDGIANIAVLELLAKALKVRKHKLRIVEGRGHPTKLIEVSDPPDHVAERLQRWRARPGR